MPPWIIFLYGTLLVTIPGTYRELRPMPTSSLFAHFPPCVSEGSDQSGIRVHRFLHVSGVVIQIRRDLNSSLFWASLSALGSGTLPGFFFSILPRLISFLFPASFFPPFYRRLSMSMWSEEERSQRFLPFSRSHCHFARSTYCTNHIDVTTTASLPNIISRYDTRSVLPPWLYDTATLF